MKQISLDTVNSLKTNDYILVKLSTTEKITQVGKFYRPAFLSYLLKNGINLYLVESDEERTMLMLGAESTLPENKI